MDLDPQPPLQPAPLQSAARIRAQRDGRAAACDLADDPRPTGAAHRPPTRTVPTKKAPTGKKQGRRNGMRRASAASPMSLYDEVTARIVDEIEAGRVPWVQPWDAAGFAPGLPKNADTCRAYSGINILILWAEAARRVFAAQGWLTFRQALAVGGAVRKGEKGTAIFYASRFTPKTECDAENGCATNSGQRGDGDTDRSVPFLKRFTVFNVAQVDGLPERCILPATAIAPREAVPVAEALLAACGADIRIGGNEAYYSPSGDYVALPPQQAFFAQIDFYRTALHELGHWTGHPSRLARDQKGAFGSAAYGREELCAELASAFLCSGLGIQPTVRHADYLGAWLAIMREDSRAIFKAASLASKAADYLMAFAPAEARAAIAAAPDAAAASRHAQDGEGG
jgi:antirestriction protein ArdC